jgi:hypothetical protein
MSMSQEEIEALMNESMSVGPSVEDTAEESSTDDSASMSQDDIAALVADSDSSDSFDNTADQDNMDSSMDDILAGIDGITDDEPEKVEPEKNNINTKDLSAIMNEQIDQGVYPMPVEKEHKVVNQLNEVAEDSEEKATKIFDVLSFILDENAEIQKDVKAMGDFIEKQTSLLTALSTKFPNIEVISQNLELAKNISSSQESVTKRLDEENNQIFVAMDLMQFHDINRQKIERVMAVIRKLSVYLNGIFEDDNSKPEVQIAKHISGDSADTVNEDDLSALIAEFSS